MNEVPPGWTTTRLGDLGDVRLGKMLDKAKNQLVTNELRQRETSNGKALALGSSAVLLGDPNRVNTELDRLQSVTAADIQRVAKKYFKQENRSVLLLYRKPAAGAVAGGVQ